MCKKRIHIYGISRVPNNYPILATFMFGFTILTK